MDIFASREFEVKIMKIVTPICIWLRFVNKECSAEGKTRKRGHDDDNEYMSIFLISIL